MNGRMLLVLILGISFLFFGCAQQAPQQPITPVVAPEEETPPAAEEVIEQPVEEPVEETVEEEVPPAEEPGEEIPEEEISEEQLADLFQVETDEPLGDEGLETGTPSSNSS